LQSNREIVGRSRLIQNDSGPATRTAMLLEGWKMRQTD
jgi:hypothetical protein